MRAITESKLGGKIRRMSFGQNAWFAFCELHKCTLKDASRIMFDEKTPTALRDLIYCGLLVSDRAEMREVDYNQYTVGEWLDESTVEELNRIYDVILSGAGTPVKASKKKQLSQHGKTV